MRCWVCDVRIQIILLFHFSYDLFLNFFFFLMSNEIILFQILHTSCNNWWGFFVFQGSHKSRISEGLWVMFLFYFFNSWWNKFWSMIYASSIHSKIHMWSSIANCFVMICCIAAKVVSLAYLHYPKKNYQ